MADCKLCECQLVLSELTNRGLLLNNTWWYTVTLSLSRSIHTYYWIISDLIYHLYHFTSRIYKKFLIWIWYWLLLFCIVYWHIMYYYVSGHPMIVYQIGVNVEEIIIMEVQFVVYILDIFVMYLMHIIVNVYQFH